MFSQKKYNILVTGGAGFIGKAIIRELLDPGSPVIPDKIRIFDLADPYHIGSLVNIAKGGFYARLGNGTAKCQHIYVGNIAHAHLQAAHALMNGSNHVGGQIYFLTDAPGSNFFKFFDQVVEGAGYRIRPVKYYHPKFSRFAVTYTCTSYTFNSDKARRDFGFKPKYSSEEALERTISYYRSFRENEN